MNFYEVITRVKQYGDLNNVTDSIERTHAFQDFGNALDYVSASVQNAIDEFSIESKIKNYTDRNVKTDYYLADFDKHADYYVRSICENYGTCKLVVKAEFEYVDDKSERNDIVIFYELYERRMESREAYENE